MYGMSQDEFIKKENLEAIKTYKDKLREQYSLVTFNPENVTAENIKNINSFDPNPSLLCPNINDIVPNEIEKIYQRSYSHHSSYTIEYYPQAEIISGKLTEHFTQIQDFSKNGQLEALIAFLDPDNTKLRRATVDSGISQLSKMHLKEEEIARVIKELDLSIPKEMELYLKSPNLYTKEDAQETIQSYILQHINAHEAYIDGGDRYMGRSFNIQVQAKGAPEGPSPFGMKPENIARRQQIINTYEQISKGNFSELTFDGNSYTALLTRAMSRSENEKYIVSKKDLREELLAEHSEEYINLVLENKQLYGANSLIQLLKEGRLSEQQTDSFIDLLKTGNKADVALELIKLDDQNNIISSPLNNKLMAVADSYYSGENEKKLAARRHDPSEWAYISKRMSEKTLSTDTLSQIVARNENKDELLAQFIASPYIDETQKRKLIEYVWLNSSYIDCKKTRQLYQDLYHEQIDNIKDAQGKTRLQNVVNSHEFDTINIFENYDIHQIKQLSASEINKAIDSYRTETVNDNLEVTSPEIFKIISQAIDRHGPQILINPLRDSLIYGTPNILMKRYIDRSSRPDELALIKQFPEEFQKHEKFFNQFGDTIYKLKDLSDLIAAKKTESIRIISKNGYKTTEKDQLYGAINNLLEKTAYNKELIPYVESIIKGNNADLRECRKFTERQYQDYKMDYARVSQNTLQFVASHPLYSKDKNLMNALIKQAVKDEAISEDLHNDLSALGYDFKDKSPFGYIRYSKNKSLHVQLPEDQEKLKRIDFNLLDYAAPNYHTSHKSQTTFLNEMCIYGKPEAAAVALNYGADPFVKNEFALGKKQGFPFAGMFYRDASNNYQNAAAFMEKIAQSLSPDKAQVLENIWKSLGRNLRENPQVSAIIRQTDKTFKTRNINNGRTAENDAEIRARIEAQKEAARIAQEQKALEERQAKEKAEQEHQEDIRALQQKLTENLSKNLVGLTDEKLIIEIGTYIKGHKEELRSLPNENELKEITDTLKNKRQEEQHQQETAKKLEQLKNTAQKTVTPSDEPSLESLSMLKAMYSKKKGKTSKG